MRTIDADELRSLAIGTGILGTGGGTHPYLELLNIEKLHEDQHQWQEAYEVRRTLGSQAGADEGRSQAILAFLENEMGLQAVARGDYPAAIVRFQSAIDLDAGVVPAYLNLGDVRQSQG